MEIETEAGVWVKADATVFKLTMGINRSERRLAAAERTISAAHRRVGIIRRLRARKAEREQAMADRALQRELDKSWGLTLRVRNLVRHTVKRHVPRQRNTRSRVSAAAVKLPKAVLPIVDDRGRVSLYFQVKYVGLKSKTWRPGLAASHIRYILREDAQEQSDRSEHKVILSNMGETVDEICAAWNVAETIEQGYRANATVQHRIVWNLPHDMSPEQRQGLVEEFCERIYGRLGLPWVAAIHLPDKEGDQRNHHAHIAFSTRPAERIDEGHWEFAQEKITDLTSPEGLKLMRALAASDRLLGGNPRLCLDQVGQRCLWRIQRA